MVHQYYLLMSTSQSPVIQNMRTISCALVCLVPYMNPMRRIKYAYWGTLMQSQVHPDLIKSVRCYMRIMQCLGITHTQIIHTHMSTMVAQHINGWIIFQLSDVLSESIVDCRTLQAVAVQITVQLLLH